MFSVRRRCRKREAYSAQRQIQRQPVLIFHYLKSDILRKRATTEPISAKLEVWQRAMKSA